jgi:hypothetical protein
MSVYIVFYDWTAWGHTFKNGQVVPNQADAGSFALYKQVYQ